MNRQFVLGKINDLMNWDDGTAQKENAWLRLMSRMKYDDYHDFLAGMRFIESLADWLQQFPQDKRAAAYEFVRNHLVFLSLREMRHLVGLFYHETVEPRLMAEAARICDVPRYLVWSTAEAKECFDRLLRKSLFVELSDGARADDFRRLNEGRISTEQVVTAPRVNDSKWNDMLHKLRKDLGSDHERFSFIFLIDDFTGSGTTLLRHEDGKWTGKLQRFWDDLCELRETHLENDWVLGVHHYVATQQAAETVEERNKRRHEEADEASWFPEVIFSFGLTFPASFGLSDSDVPDFSELVQTYYDPAIENEHTRKGGTDVRWGFGRCGLPLVLEHNTPNNTIPLIWAETVGKDGAHAMRPLFRRRQRHS